MVWLTRRAQQNITSIALLKATFVCSTSLSLLDHGLKCLSFATGQLNGDVKRRFHGCYRLSHALLAGRVERSWCVLLHVCPLNTSRSYLPVFQNKRRSTIAASNVTGLLTGSTMLSCLCSASLALVSTAQSAQQAPTRMACLASMQLAVSFLASPAPTTRQAAQEQPMCHSASARLVSRSLLSSADVGRTVWLPALLSSRRHSSSALRVHPHTPLCSQHSGMAAAAAAAENYCNIFCNSHCVFMFAFNRFPANSLAGTFGLSCSQCVAGSWCPGGPDAAINSCGTSMQSPAGSRTESNCVCAAGEHCALQDQL
jgi:hypothetical protein